MREVLVAISVLAFGLTSAAPSSSATVAPAATELARLFGSWNCEGFAAGSSSVETYARQNDGTVTLTNRVHTSVGSEGTIVETFAFDPTHGTWTLSAPPNPLFGGLQLSGGRWNGERWVLSGTEVVQNAPRPVRIVYTSLGNGAFRREHQAASGAAWINDGEFVCKRSGAPAPPLSAGPVNPSTPRSVVARAAATPLMASRPSSALPTPAPPTVAPPTVAPPTVAPPTVTSPTVPPTTFRPSTVAPHDVATPTTLPSHVASRTPIKIAARPAPGTDSSTSLGASDRAFALVGPAWFCESVGGEPSKHRYTRDGVAGITLHDDVRVAQHTYAIVETYRFDAARRVWTTAVQGGGYTGTAAPWLHSKWVFDGIETERGRRSPVRMIYTTLGDQAFRRDFQLAGAGQAQTFVSETCTRS